MYDMSLFFNPLVNFILTWWYLLLIIFLVIVLPDLWLFSRREKYKKNLKWALLRISVPKIPTTPYKAMEQIFAAMHSMYSFGILWKQKWFKGVVENWASFEIVGRNGELEFYVRVLESFRNTVESAVYSQYPDAEIVLVPPEDDYVNQFGTLTLKEDYDIWGSDFILARDDAYPLRTYEYFDHLMEEKRIDPLALLSEAVSNLKPAENVWIQILIRATGDGWIKKGQKLAAELMGEKSASKSGLGKALDSLIEFVKNFFIAFVRPPEWGEGDKAGEAKNKNLSPGNRKIVEAVENKISKIGFETVIRFVDVNKKDDFVRDNINAVMGFLRQFNTNNLNSLRPNLATMPIAKKPFKKMKVDHKKKMLFLNYRLREFPSKFSILNVEELATIYHLPLASVKAPTVERVLTKKGRPPANLPTIGS